MKNVKLISKLFDSFESDLTNIKEICETLSESSELTGISSAVNAFTVELNKLRISIINDTSSDKATGNSVLSEEEKNRMWKEIEQQDADHIYNDPNSMTTSYHFDDDPSNKDNGLFNYIQLINIINSLRKEPFFALEPLFSLWTDSFEFINSDITIFRFIHHALLTYNDSNNMIADSNKWNSTILNILSSNEWKAVFDHYNAFESCVKYNQVDIEDDDIRNFITVNARNLKIIAVLKTYQEILNICNINLPSGFEIKPITPWYDII